MNAKQAKRLRKHTSHYLQMVTGDEDASVRDAAYDHALVPSKTCYVIVPETTTDEQGLTTTTKVRKDNTAVRVRLVGGIGRSIYKRVKKRVQTVGRSEQQGILRQLRDLSIGAGQGAASSGVEHAGAAGVQPPKRNVY